MDSGQSKLVRKLTTSENATYAYNGAFIQQ